MTLQWFGIESEVTGFVAGRSAWRKPAGFCTMRFAGSKLLRCNPPISVQNLKLGEFTRIRFDQIARRFDQQW